MDVFIIFSGFYAP